jgi:hypothetical protein
MYECSKSGAVRNKHTSKLRPVEASPRPGDPHVYVRLVLKDSEMQHGNNNQKRLALRNVVAHAWVPGFTLTAEGNPSSSLRVYHKNKNPRDCRAGNLVILTEQQAHSQGLNLTRSRSRGDNTPTPPPAAEPEAAVTTAVTAAAAAAAAATAATAAAAANAEKGTPMALLQQAVAQPQFMNAGNSMVWPAGYDSQGHRV